MASISAAIGTPVVSNRLPVPSSDAFFKPLPVKLPQQLKTTTTAAPTKLRVEALSLVKKAVSGATTAAIAASMVVPESAMAADGITPSLKNFLLSIVAGGVVLAVIGGAVIAVANFDPVKRS